MSEETKVLLAVSPDAPEWMRDAARAMAEGHKGAHGAILIICYDETETQLAYNINGDDLISAISNLADLMREKFGKKLGKKKVEALIEFAISERTEGEE